MRGIRATCAVVLVSASVLVPRAAASPPPYPALFVVGADGSGREGVFDLAVEFGGSVDWSADGTRIAFPALTGGIYVVGADGSDPHAVAEAPEGRYLGPDWSPDGSRIAFVHEASIASDLYAIGADGTGLTRLTADAAAEGPPVWSPAGTHIAYLRWDPGAPADLVVAEGDGSGARAVASGVHGLPRWSPDGTRIAVTRGEYLARDVVVVNADGSGERNITPGEGDDHDADWSPDGTRIAFSSRTGLTTADASDGGNRIDLHPRAFDPSWSPDGTRIVFADGYDVMTISPDGTAAEEVSASPWTLSFEPRWSPDGERIAFLAHFLDGRDHCGGTEQGTRKPFGAGAHVTGTEGDDHLEGTRKRDVICGFDGTDRISGGGRPDEIFAGAGDDRVAGGPGPDWIEGDGSGWRREAVAPGGTDTLLGGLGNDRLLGGPGDDVLRGGRGRDRLRGGRGYDICLPGRGRDVVRKCEVVR